MVASIFFFPAFFFEFSPAPSGSSPFVNLWAHTLGVSGISPGCRLFIGYLFEVGLLSVRPDCSRFFTSPSPTLESAIRFSGAIRDPFLFEFLGQNLYWQSPPIRPYSCLCLDDRQVFSSSSFPSS